MGQIPQIQNLPPEEIQRWYESEGLTINSVTTSAELRWRGEALQKEQRELQAKEPQGPWDQTQCTCRGGHHKYVGFIRSKTRVNWSGRFLSESELHVGDSTFPDHELDPL